MWQLNNAIYGVTAAVIFFIVDVSTGGGAQR